MPWTYELPETIFSLLEHYKFIKLSHIIYSRLETLLPEMEHQLNIPRKLNTFSLDMYNNLWNMNGIIRRKAFIVLKNISSSEILNVHFAYVHVLMFAKFLHVDDPGENRFIIYLRCVEKKYGFSDGYRLFFCLHLCPITGLERVCQTFDIFKLWMKEKR